MRTSINWRIFAILFSLSILSILCVIPYVITLQGETIKKLGYPLGTIFLAQLLQSSILFAITIFLGLYVTKKINFHLPLFESFLQKRPTQNIFKDIVGISMLCGAGTAACIYLLDTVFTMAGATISTHQPYAPIWQTLLAALYGGIAEEILMRLFLMTCIVWIGMKLFRRDTPTQPMIIVAMILAAGIFGAGHLPVTAALTTLTPLVVIRAIVLNGIGGIVFGLLFWKKGFESAMIAHFTTDIFLLTLLPLLFN